MQIFNKKTVSIAATSLILAGSLILPRLAVADSGPALLTGDIFTGTNNTTGNGTWSDPVNAASGNVIEMRILAQNMDSSLTAHNVVLRAVLPNTLSTTPTATADVTDDAGGSVSDNLTVDMTDGSQQGFGDVVAGHSRLFDSECPNGCQIADTVESTGINVGDLASGESAQVLFKVYLTNYVSASPTPTPTPTPTVAPTATPSPTPGTGGNTNNNNNTNCTNNGSTSSNTCSSSSSSSSSATGGSVTINTTAPATTPVVVTTAVSPSVQTLPETGLPLAGLALGGLLPAGLKMRKFGKGKGDVLDLSANHIWEDKQFKKS